MKKALLSAICLPATVLAQVADVDIKPGDALNVLNVQSDSQAVHVAVLSTSVADGDAVDFDATLVDAATVRFGPAQAEPRSEFLGERFQDVDADGDLDIDLVFAVADTGIVCGEESAGLIGETVAAIPFSGSDLVSTGECPSCHGGTEPERDAGNELFVIAEDTPLVEERPVAGGYSALEANVAHGALSIAPDGSFTYFPADDYNGLDAFQYRTTDASVRSVQISVTPVNDLAVATPDAVGLAAGQTVVRSAPGVLANDFDVEGDLLTVALDTDVEHGTLSLYPDGGFEYVPGAEFPGYDQFSYTVNDGIGNSAAVEVKISFPNILLIMVDDLGQGDLSIYNPGSALVTPNLDALASAGMMFTNAHAAAATCSPTRYSLISGNYPWRARRSKGVWKSNDPETMLVPGQQTIGHVAQSADYHTGFIGKLHNGGAFWNESGTEYTQVHEDIDYARPFDKGPTQFGFDYSFVLPGGVGTGPYVYFENDRAVEYVAETDSYEPFTDAATARAAMVRTLTNDSLNGGRIGNGGYAMATYDSRKAGSILTERALNFVDEHLARNALEGTDRPFMLYMGLPEIHTPWTPPPVFNPANPRDISVGAPGTPIAGSSPISARTDLVYEIDAILGTLVSRLEEQGILDNTLIILKSDNGVNNQGVQSGYRGTGERIETGPAGDQHFNAQGIKDGIPLRGYKNTVYEGGHLSPLIMRWGDGSPAGSVISPASVAEQMIGSQDLFATFADLLGVEVPAGQANDSFSFRSLLLDPAASTEVRDHMIVQGGGLSAPYGYLDRAIYMHDPAGELWKLVAVAEVDDRNLGLSFTDLYNLSLDPGESNNLLDDAAAQPWLVTMSSAYMTLINSSQTND